MPTEPDTDLDLLDGDTGDDSADSEETGDETDTAGAGGEIDRRKLQSDRDKERARANKAEAELKRLRGEKPVVGAEQNTGGMPPEMAAWLASAKEAARDRWYNSDPRFAAYGLDVALVEGDTPEVVQASAKRLTSLIDAIESKARDSVLAEHGISPAPAGSGSGSLPDFGSMNDDDFDKLVAGVTGKRF